MVQAAEPWNRNDATTWACSSNGGTSCRSLLVQATPAVAETTRRSSDAGHIAVQNAPPVNRNDEEAIEYVKSERWHGEEVHRRDRLTVVAQKRRPSFCPVRASWNFPIQRSTVRSEMSKPGIFSSPWIRGAPHVRFSATMRKISSRSSLLVHLLPTRLPRRESQFQYSLNPARCQRTTVSG